MISRKCDFVIEKMPFFFAFFDHFLAIFGHFGCHFVIHFFVIITLILAVLFRSSGIERGQWSVFSEFHVFSVLNHFFDPFLSLFWPYFWSF